MNFENFTELSFKNQIFKQYSTSLSLQNAEIISYLAIVTDLCRYAWLQKDLKNKFWCFLKAIFCKILFPSDGHFLWWKYFEDPGIETLMILIRKLKAENILI